MHLANRRAEIPDGVGTLLVSRQPFTAQELDRLDAEAARLEFDVPFSPRVATDDTYIRLTTLDGLEAFLDAYPIDISAPTDDSPFFFNMLRLRDVLNLELMDFGKQSHNMKAVATLAVLLATVSALTVLCILLPLWLRRDRVSLSGAGPFFLFFTAIGLGFMLIETSLMQRPIIALGHPTYGLSVVLFSLLLSSGAGSLLTGGVTSQNVPSGGRRRLIVLVAVLATFGIVTPFIASRVETMTTVARILGAVAILSPLGSSLDGLSTRHEVGGPPRAGTDCLVLGAQRCRIGTGIGAERVHRADVVDLDCFLGGLGLLLSRAVRFHPCCPPERWTSTRVSCTPCALMSWQRRRQLVYGRFSSRQSKAATLPDVGTSIQTFNRPLVLLHVV